MAERHPVDGDHVEAQPLSGGPVIEEPTFGESSNACLFVGPDRCNRPAATVVAACFDLADHDHARLGVAGDDVEFASDLSSCRSPVARHDVEAGATQVRDRAIFAPTATGTA